MRVVIATDGFRTLSSSAVGAAMGRGWSALGAQVAVVPMGTAGAGLVEALGDLLGDAPELITLDDQPVGIVVAPQAAVPTVALNGPAQPTRTDADGIDATASSVPVGRRLAAALEVLRETAGDTPSGRIVIDLTAGPLHDGGAGLLGALGATADVPLDGGVDALSGITRLDLSAVRERLGEVELVLAVPSTERDAQLTGLRGITSVRGHAAGVVDPALLLRLDQALLDLAAASGAEPATIAPGSGAAGVGWAIQALGGRIVGGAELCAELAGLAGTVGVSDLVVTGADQLDFGTMGGEVISAAIQVAGRRLRPVVALAGTNFISGRELRSVGIEAAYSVRADPEERPEQPITAQEIADRAATVARSWSW